MKKFLLTALLVSSFGVATAATYTIDPHHANARFSTDHNGTSSNVGGFFMLEGKVQFDPAKKTGAVDVVIPISKLNSGNPDFDKHLKTPDFFNADKFPDMRFVSDKFVFDGDKLKEVEGKLTILGKTQTVVLNAAKFNCYHNKMANKEACGGDFKAKIKPTDWGFKAPTEAKIKIQIEAFKD
ncbi:MAG: polyisoprenoid-binding protein [Neisseriaceae bacterium]|nr:polyisoprenoid-binding protein [Neisseriaceae bacterium]MBQ9723958.1 polyisoprenoid-binding protein [Neisseriaceae bacterium]MBR1819694.1 polyisoprenoid-binding protein [Neisseriaceae bacterium]